MIVTREQLEAMVGEPQSLPDDPYAARIEAIKRFVEKSGAVILNVQEKEDQRGRYTVISLAECPIKKGEMDGHSGILIFPDGRFAYHCFHERCSGKGFSDVERAWGLKFRDFVEGLLCGTQRIFNDPLRLAERHLAIWRKDDFNTLAVFHGETYRYASEFGWQRASFSELEPWIRKTVQQAYDEHSEALGRITGQVKPIAVRGNIVADTFKAMQQICAYAVPPTAIAPFWLDQYGEKK